ncbi:MaoC family dehydratase [uncultured Propionivibrio sp.]|uniref:MaoC family dehydratase n=1 Tax=uncultured Propionivibrio sp. TaxID=426737 RepID=UPI0029C099D0|nr:MaoC family dehydratase [uncultured Propionivibrio sp.]
MTFQNILGKGIDEIEVGDKAYFAKTISEYDVYQFASVTCDFNPAHINEAYAADTFFKHRIAHGMLTLSLVSNILGTQFPGPGTIFVSQNVRFLAPVFIGDTIEMVVAAVELDRARNRMTFSCEGVNQNGVKVLEGDGVVMPPKKRKPKPPAEVPGDTRTGAAAVPAA